jgi:hypothetical protein
MRVANWLMTLLINLAFGLGAASDLGTASRTAPHAAVAQRSCPFLHRAKTPHLVSPSRYLAAVRMGWTIG